MIAERAPQTLEALLAAALSAVREGNDEQALTSLDRLVAQSMIATHARADAAEGELPRGTQRLLAEAQQLHGAIRLGRRELAEAEQALRAALKLYVALTAEQPGAVAADAEQLSRTYVMLGSLLLQRGRLHDARAEFARARNAVAQAGDGERVTELRTSIDEAEAMCADIGRRLKRMRIALVILAIFVATVATALIALWQSGAL